MVHGATRWLLGLGLITSCGSAPSAGDCETECGSSTGSPGSTSMTVTESSGSQTADGTDTAMPESTGAPTGTQTSSDDDDTQGSSGTGDPPPASPRCGDPRLVRSMPSFAPPIELSSNDGTGGSAVGDLDGDGRDEFVAQMQFRIYDWVDEAWNSHQPLADLAGRGDRFAGDIELADIDGDGDLDIVVPDSDNAGTQGGLSWFENPGARGGAWVEHAITTFAGAGEGDVVTHLSELEVGDIDGDGRTDLVVRDISHGVWVFIQTGDGGDDWAPRTFIEVLPREGLELSDLDEDGDLDILLNGVWLQTDDAVAGAYTLHPMVGMDAWYAPDLSTASVRDYASKVEAGDFDGDGRVDVAITNAEELDGSSPGKPRGISVFLQPADPIGGEWSEVMLTDQHWSWHTLVLADFDFDGSLDVMSAISAVGTDDAGDEITLWLNAGDGGSFTPQTVSTAHTVYQGALGDADGDGDCDFLAPDHFASGPVRYFENTTAP
jgi:hypothetical protein